MSDEVQLNEYLVEIIKNYPYIWNKKYSAKTVESNNKRAKSFSEITKMVNSTFQLDLKEEAVKLKWRNIRKSFNNANSRIKSNKSSKKYYLSEKLTFLTDQNKEDTEDGGDEDNEDDDDDENTPLSYEDVKNALQNHHIVVKSASSTQNQHHNLNSISSTSTNTSPVTSKQPPPVIPETSQSYKIKSSKLDELEKKTIEASKKVLKKAEQILSNKDVNENSLLQLYGTEDADYLLPIQEALCDCNIQNLLRHVTKS